MNTKNEIKILFFFSDREVSDSNLKIISFAEALASRGITVRYLLSESESSLAEVLRKKKQEVEYLKQPQFYAKPKYIFADIAMVFQYAKKIIRYAEMYDFDLVHTRGIFASLMSIFLRIRLNCALLWNAWDLPRNQYQLISFMGSVFTDKIIFKSDDFGAVFEKEIKKIGYQAPSESIKKDAA